MIHVPSPVQALHDPLYDSKGVKLWVKRDDLLHPHIMGNKWRKLKYNLRYAQENGYKGILTFGGAFSNHIAATAASCREFGLQAIGIIRGEELHAASNATLRFASGQGMHLEFVSRSSYRDLKKISRSLLMQYPDFLCLPEGGTNAHALQGCAEIIDELQDPFDYLITPLGTGGTMAGLLQGLRGRARLIGISSLKGDFVHSEFRDLIQKNDIAYSNYELMNQFHFGGYGKVTSELVDFVNMIKKSHNLQLDPIYTGKMMFAIHHLLLNDYFQEGSDIVMLHTGGLQGIEGFNDRNPDRMLIS